MHRHYIADSKEFEILKEYDGVIGFFIKIFFINAKKNGNKWAVDWESIQRNIGQVLGIPIVLQPNLGHPDFHEQDFFAKGYVVDYALSKSKKTAYVIARIMDSFTIQAIKDGKIKFSSPAVVARGDDYIDEIDGVEWLREWVPVHLALVNNPAYGKVDGKIKGICEGDGEKCKVKLHSAKKAWDESKHPRGKDGTFGKGGGSKYTEKGRLFDDGMMELLEKKDDDEINFRLKKRFKETQDKASPEAKAEFKKELDEFYKHRYDNAKSLFRGTTLGEVVNMYTSGKVGHDPDGGVGLYPFVCTSVNRQLASDFADGQRTQGALIEFVKNDYMKEHTVSMGYNVEKDWVNAKKIEEEQGAVFLYEEEHRLPRGELDLSKMDIVIHMTGVPPRQQESYQKEFGDKFKFEFYSDIDSMARQASGKTLEDIVNEMMEHIGDKEMVKTNVLKWMPDVPEEMVDEILGKPDIRTASVISGIQRLASMTQQAARGTPFYEHGGKAGFWVYTKGMDVFVASGQTVEQAIREQCPCQFQATKFKPEPGEKPWKDGKYYRNINGVDVGFESGESVEEAIEEQVPKDRLEGGGKKDKEQKEKPKEKEEKPKEKPKEKGLSEERKKELLALDLEEEDIAMITERDGKKVQAYVEEMRKKWRTEFDEAEATGLLDDEELAGLFNDRMNAYIEERWNQADSLYRGTTIHELNNYLDVGVTGMGGNYPFTCISTNPEIGRQFGGTKKDTGIIIEYPKDVIADKVDHQGYAVTYAGDGQMGEPQSLVFLDEEEHRIRRGTKVEDLGMTIHAFAGMSDPEGFKKKYGKLGKIVFHEDMKNL